MASGMAGCWHQYKLAVAKHVVLTINKPIVKRVIPVRAVVSTLRRARHLHFGALHNEGRLREQCVASTVIKMEMRVDNVGNVRGSEPQSRELIDDVLVRGGTKLEVGSDPLTQAANGILLSVAYLLNLSFTNQFPDLYGRIS